jgi:hypothetical protein
VPIDSASGGRYQYHGQSREASVEASAHVHAKAGRWLAFECQAGPALRLTSLDIDVFGTTTSDHDVRVNPTVNAGAIVDLALGARVGFGALVDASILLDRQRYWLKSVVTIEEPAVDFLFGARLSVGID